MTTTQQSRLARIRAAREKIATEIRYHCGKVNNALDADRLAQRIGEMEPDE